MEWVDLRSDTVTRPTAAMRAAMLAAEVGDDVYGEDPTVNALQQRLAAELGFDAGLFVPSGTQSNLLALMSHCERGDEYLVGADAHTYKFEGGGAAVLGSIQPQPIVQAADGSLPLERIEAAIKPVDPHFARTRVLALENTWHGRTLPLDYLQAAHDTARAHGLGLHLDGARLFNAAIACNVPAREIAGVDLLGQYTNMVFINVPAERLRELDVHLRDAGIRISIGYLPTLRLVTHLDVDDAGIERTAAAFAEFFGRG